MFFLLAIAFLILLAFLLYLLFFCCLSRRSESFVLSVVLYLSHFQSFLASRDAIFSHRHAQLSRSTFTHSASAEESEDELSEPLSEEEELSESESLPEEEEIKTLSRT